jgi:apolipoprotein N-acyltransferase
VPPVLLAALSGVLLFLSFPTLGHPAAAWLALVPLLVAVAGATPWRALRLGAVTGLVHFAGTLYWIPAVMIDYGGLPAPAAWFVHALLVAVLATFPALFAAGTAELTARFGPGGLLLAPAIWVTTELGRMHLFTGFPWALIGYSQVPLPVVAQAASVVGVLGVSALVVAVNGAIAHAVVAGPGAKRSPIGVTAALVAVVVGFGAWRLQDGSLLQAGAPLRVAALQGNFRQDEKWNPLRSDAILQTYLEQTQRAAGAGARLVIWPESATPFALDRDPRGAAVRTAAQDSGAHLLVGTTEVVRDAGTRYYNAAYLIEPGRGSTAGVYRKQHLVPFGEYVPLRSALFFVSPLVESVADFSAGTEARTLPVDDGSVGTAICYEIIYPGLVRELVLRGSGLLATVTNDAWYGRTAAPYQHFQQATMRAIEQGRFLVRAANTGISGVIDPYGRVLASSGLFEPAVVVEDVRILEGLTIYGRFGDVTAYAGAVVAVAALGYGRRRRFLE